MSSVVSTCWKRLASCSVVFQHYPRRASKHTHICLRERPTHNIFKSKPEFCRQCWASLIAQISFLQIYRCTNHKFSLQHCPNAFTDLCACKVRKYFHSNLQTGDEIGSQPRSDFRAGMEEVPTLLSKESLTSEAALGHFPSLVMTSWH